MDADANDAAAAAACCSLPPHDPKPAAATHLISSQHALRVGDTFASYDALVERLQRHSAADFVNYWRRDTRTLNGARTKTSRPLAACLRYYSVRYACVHGGQRFGPRGTGRRQKATMRRDCPAHISVRASKCGTRLEVIAACNEHNHAVGELEAGRLPQNRRLEAPERAAGVEMREIVERVRRTTGKATITAKDVTNMRRREERNRVVLVQQDEGAEDEMNDDHSLEILDADDLIEYVDLETANAADYPADRANDDEEANVEYLSTMSPDLADDDSLTTITNTEEPAPLSPAPIAPKSPIIRQKRRRLPATRQRLLQAQIDVLLARKRQLLVETQMLRQTKQRLLAETAALRKHVRKKSAALE